MLALVGTCVNVWLLIEDLRTDRVLTNVTRKEGLTDLITSPKPEERRLIEERTDIPDNVKGYLLHANQRNALKRSMAK